MRATTIHISLIIPRSRIRPPCGFKSVPIPSVRLHLLSLATGTVCQSLFLRTPTGALSSFSLSFDAHVSEFSRIVLTISRISVRPVPTDAEVYVLAEFLPTAAVSSSSVRSPKGTTVTWSRMPPLPLEAPSLRALVHASLSIQLRNMAATSTSPCILPIHHIWSAIAFPTRPYPIKLSISPEITVSLSITADVGAPTGQMVGGVTTDNVVSGAHPVVFGTALAHTTRFPQVPDVPVPWLSLTDTFGYRYYHHARSGVNVWTLPPDDSVTTAQQNDQRLAEFHDFHPAKYGVFRSRTDCSNCVWIHPAAARLSIPDFTPTSDDRQQEDNLPRTSSLSTLELSDLHPAVFTASINNPADTIHREPPRAQIVEMRCTDHPTDRTTPTPGTEGHTFTSMHAGKTVLKFAGSSGARGTRNNALYALDVDSMLWRSIDAAGVLPSPRSGHGAVALGSDQSRMLIFGGHSRQGRLNDLHLFHEGTKTWSPVSYTGTPPGVRARMGMTVTSDGATVLVFGGRSSYRYLGGKYYDALYVNAFHAERTEWIQMRPQGSGPKPASRSCCVLEFINDRHMFLHGGIDDGVQVFDDTFIFDMVSSSWQQIPYPNEPTRPTARESHASTVMGSQVITYGGSSKYGVLKDLQVFDAGKLRWLDAPNIVGDKPGKRSGAAMVSVDDSRVVIVGGDNGFSMTTSTITIEVSHRSALDANELKELAMERGPDAKSCVVCLDSKVDTMFLWCGHSVCCRDCSKMVKYICPVCRKPFSEIVNSQFG